MSELTALRKFPCPACGAEAEWNPGKQMLVCPFCGTQSPAEIKSDGTLVEENDLIAALRSLPEDQRGWAAEKKTVRCQNCNAISVFDEKRVAQRCDFCGSPSLISVDDMKSPVRPAGVLAFTVANSKVREDIRQWYGSHWFAPNNLKDKALTDTLHGIYLPYWTFDAHVSADWTAEAGYRYTVRGSDGKSETRIRWEHASGALEHFFDDTLVSASQGVHQKLLVKMEPFPTTTALLPYDPAYLSGWVVEQYQIDLVAAAQAARTRMDGEVRSMCSRQVPGDTQRNLNVQADYSAQTYKHILLPVWLLTYNYGHKTFQVSVNGATGKIAGEYPISWIKVTLVVIAALIVIIIFVMLQGNK
jgi:Zn finger protein HypA/HybF involved in hydrogenase expression